jgi:hypothetical protein
LLDFVRIDHTRGRVFGQLRQTVEEAEVRVDNVLAVGKNHRLLRFVIAISALVLLAVGLGAVALMTRQLEAAISREMVAGSADLERGFQALRPTDPKLKPQPSEALSSFARADGHYRSAKAHAENSRILAILAGTPVVAIYVSPRRHTALDLADMGMSLADAGSRGADFQMLLATKPSTIDGGNLITFLKNAGPLITRADADLTRAKATGDEADISVMPEDQRHSLVAARARTAKAASGMSAFRQLLPLLTDLLGGHGARTYLIEQVNPAELRSGGGFIGTVTLLQLDAGNFRVLFSGDVSEFDHYQGRNGAPGYVPPLNPSTYVAPPNPFTGWYGGQSWYFADSNFFPDFATNAKWGTFFANRLQGVQADGVIALDYYAVAAMLNVTGPIALPKFGVTLDSKNFAQELIGRDVANDPTHKAIVAEATNELLAKVRSLPADRWPNLIQVFSDAVAARHFQVNFANAAVERQISALGWSSIMNSKKAGDFLYETEDNLGGTKGNIFLTRHFTLGLTRANGNLHHKVTVDFGYQPPAGIHGYPSDHYYAYLRFYAKEPLTNVNLKKSSSEYTALIPAPYPDTGAPSGYKASDGWIFIDAGPGHSGHMQLTFEYDTPWTTDKTGHHLLIWEKQPGTNQDPVVVSWTYGRKTYSTPTTIDQDRAISVGPNGITIAPATPSRTLPSLGF